MIPQTNQQLLSLLGSFFGCLLAFSVFAMVLSIEPSIKSYKYWVAHIALTLVVIVVASLSLRHPGSENEYIDTGYNARDQIGDKSVPSKQVKEDGEQSAINLSDLPTPSFETIHRTVSSTPLDAESSQPKQDMNHNLTSTEDPPTATSRGSATPQVQTKQQDQQNNGKKSRKQKRSKVGNLQDILVSDSANIYERNKDQT